MGAVARYKCISYQRKYLNSVLIHEDIENVDINGDDNIEKFLEKDQLKKEVDSLLSALNPKDKEIFIRHYINEEKVRDIAEIYSVNEEVIYNRISRGKKNMKYPLEYLNDVKIDFSQYEEIELNDIEKKDKKNG